MDDLKSGQVRIRSHQQARKWAEDVIAANPGKAMTPTARLLLVWLAQRWHKQHDRHGIRASVRYIAKKTGCGKNSVERALQELQAGRAVENIADPESAARWILSPGYSEVVVCPQNGDTHNPKVGTLKPDLCPQNGDKIQMVPASQTFDGFARGNGTSQDGAQKRDCAASDAPEIEAGPDWEAVPWWM